MDACKCLLSSACCTPFSSEGGSGHREFAHQSERCLFRGQVSVSLQRTGSVGNDSRQDCSLSQKLSQREALESLGGIPGSRAHLWGHSMVFMPGPGWLLSPRQPQVNLPPSEAHRWRQRSSQLVSKLLEGSNQPCVAHNPLSEASVSK